MSYGIPDTCMCDDTDDPDMEYCRELNEYERLHLVNSTGILKQVSYE